MKVKRIIWVWHNTFLVIAIISFAIVITSLINHKGITGYAVFQDDSIDFSYWLDKDIYLFQENEMVIDDDAVYFASNDSDDILLEFDARFTDSLIEHESWQLGGFATSDTWPPLSKDERAVFYVDAGVLNAFVRDDKEIEWCKPFTKFDWEEYHDFKIAITTDKTYFYIDNEKVCSIPKVTTSKLPVMFGEKNKRGKIKMFVKNVMIFS